MNDRAFTLVELVAVIVILALIFLVSFPNLTSMLKSSEKEKDQKNVEDLCLAGESYIYSDETIFPGKSIVGNTITISIEILRNEKYTDFKENGSVQYTVNADGSLNCIYIKG